MALKKVVLTIKDESRDRITGFEDLDVILCLETGQGSVRPSPWIMEIARDDIHLDGQNRIDTCLAKIKEIGTKYPYFNIKETFD